MNWSQLPQSLTEWEATPLTNDVSKAKAVAKRQIDDVVSGKQQLVLIFAPPGADIGALLDRAKQGFAKKKMKPVLPNVGQASKMLDHFESAAGNCPIIIDEAKGAITNPLALEALRRAIGPSSDRRHSIGVGSKKRTINLNVPIILATEAIPDELVTSARTTLQTSVYTIQPPVIVPRSDRMLWEHCVHHALTSDLLVPQDLEGQELENAIQAAALAITCFTTHVRRLIAIDARLMVRFAKFARENPSIQTLESPWTHPELNGLFTLPGMTQGAIGLQPDWASLLRERIALDRRSKMLRLPPPCAAPSERLAPHNVKGQRASIEA